MDVLVWASILCCFKNTFYYVNAQTENLNRTTTANESVTGATALPNSTVMPENWTVPDSERSVTEGSNVSATFPGEPGGTTQWIAAGSSAATAEATAPTAWNTAGPSTSTPSRPLPVSGFLPPPDTNLSNVCPCDVAEGRCDVNCCCDQSCGGQTALFTDCSAPLLVGDERLCSRDVVRYSLRAFPDGAQRVHTSALKEDNPDVFCIHATKYEALRMFADPEIPTDGNFESLFGRFAGPYFGSAQDNGSLDRNNGQDTSGYTYGDTIQVVDETGTKGHLRLPDSGSTAHCLDTNPAAFLKDQSTRCIQTLDLAQDCATLPALNLKSYTDFRILSVKHDGNSTVDVEVSSITTLSLDGMLSPVDSPQAHLYAPALLESPNSINHLICQNVVLQVYYVVTYDEMGSVASCAASFVLGAVDSTMVPVQQEFSIKFVQVGSVGVSTSGNPGYVIGLPLVAGSRTADGIVRSVDSRESLTLFHSSSTQDCLGKSVSRSPILFGINMVSGCTLRLEDTIDCTIVSEVLLNILRGENHGRYVAGFGNSQPEMVMDWVPIRSQTIPTSMQGSSIPLSLDIEVQWTKYGSLLNPQAQIVNITEVIRTNTSDLRSLTGGNVVLPISTSVTFVDVSAPAQPGYKALPTIDAKLPFDFFFPFV